MTVVKVEAALEAAGVYKSSLPKKKSKTKSKARTKGAAPLSEVKKTKHKGSRGETSYGQKMKEPAMGKTKTRFGQGGN